LLSYSSADFSIPPNRVVLVDFGLVGIAKLAFDPHPNLTHSRVTMGTVNYMAPEQHIDAKRVDYRSDIYSAGVIFFELLTGDLPLGRYLMPQERGLKVPVQVDSILARALAPQVEQRYNSAEEFIKALEAMLEEQRHAQETVVLSTNNSLTITNIIYKSRYPVLFVLAAVFFAVGIKLSFPAKISKPLIEEKPKIIKK
jgi:serine/threonine protein kinase